MKFEDVRTCCEEGCEEVRTCCEEATKPCAEDARRVASALRALEAPDWPSLTQAVLGRDGTRREVVQRLADMLDPHAESDRWENLKADVDKTPCTYFGYEEAVPCHRCDHRPGYCREEQLSDIVRRAMVLAGVGE